MKNSVKVLGTGCPTCQKLFNDVTEVITELNMDVDFEKIEDLQKIMEYGIISVPALIVNEEIKFAGKSPNKEELIKYLTEDNEHDKVQTCSCDCHC